MGSIYLQGLNEAGIQTTPKSISDGVTGTRCMVLISPDSERTMHTYLGITAELSQDQIDFEPLKQQNGFILKVIFLQVKQRAKL